MQMHQNEKKRRGFTIAEAVVAIGIFSFLIMVISWIMIRTFRANAVIWEQLKTQSDGRRAIQLFVDDARRAESSSIGSFPIVTAGEYEFTFYANTDTDLFRERIRFYITTTTLFRGVVKPTGTPLGYNDEDEVSLPIATDVVNIADAAPVFEYFDEAYTGTQDPLTQPVNLTDIRVVRIQLELEKDPTETPIPLHVESTLHIRNLKEN